MQPLPPTPTGEPLRAWAEVDLQAVRRNVARLRAVLTPGTQALAVLKADAYGLGAVAFARALRGAVEMLGVAECREAVELRTAGVDTPILVLGASLDEELPVLVRHGITPTIAAAAQALTLQRIARDHLGTAGRQPVHLAVETGMNRHGAEPDEVPALLDVLARQCPNLVLDGLYTHLSTPGEPTRGFTHRQLRHLFDTLAAARQHGFEPPLVHAAASAGAVNYPSARCTMIRLGLALYGGDPGWWPAAAAGMNAEPAAAFTPAAAAAVNANAAANADATAGATVEPVVALRARVLGVRTLHAGEPVSYDRSQYAAHDTRLATLAIGYADGVRRALSGRGHVLLHGQRCPIVGRVTMDATIVDVGHLPAVQPGDVATLLGRDGAAAITLAEVAEQAGTIPYEILCGLGRRVPRCYGDMPAAAPAER